MLNPKTEQQVTDQSDLQATLCALRAGPARPAFQCQSLAPLVLARAQRGCQANSIGRKHHATACCSCESEVSET